METEALHKRSLNNLQELKNTIIFKGYYVSKMSPQTLTSPISSPNKCNFLLNYTIYKKISGQS